MPKLDDEPIGSRSLSSPHDDHRIFYLWLVILAILGLTLFLFGTLAFLSREDPSTAAFLMAPATTALGFIGGVLAPSPATSAGGGATP